MKKVTKAVLLSAFIMPGLGHIFLKKYVTGIVLASITFAGFWYIISKAVARALQIVEKIQTGEVQLDVVTITQLVSKHSTGTETQLTNIATIAIIVCWLVGVFDSYRIGSVYNKTR